MNSFGDEGREDISPVLITTKIQRPRLGPDLVSRPHLISRLNHGSHRKLTLISGHAGSGKSTLLTQWLEDYPQPCAWFAIDEHDNDLMVFTSYLCAAIKSVFPKACEEALDLLHAPQAPPPRVIVTTLVNELNDLCQSQNLAKDNNRRVEGFLICLDDYHNIKEPNVHELLSTLIRYLPQCMHLVLTSRTDPPLPLASLRAREEMFEIRTSDLQFSADEARDLLEITAGRKLNDETVDLLVEKTEGWAVGLRMAALSLRDLRDDRIFAERFKGTSNPIIVDYLLGEVLSQRSLEQQDFLLRTSFLDRFSSDLCDEVLGFEDDSKDGQHATSGSRSHSLLQELIKSNLFLLPLDQEQRWYRYHHLFRDLLQHRLQRQFESEYIVHLHERASRWFEKNGFIEEALTHAFAAGNLVGASRIVEGQRYSLMNQARWQRLERYYRQFPADFARQRPELLMLKSWLVYHQGHYDQLPQLLGELESAIDRASISTPNIRFLGGEISSLKSLIHYFQNNPKLTIEEAENSIRNTASEIWIVRVLARLFLAGGYLFQGERGHAYEMYYRALDDEVIQSNRFKATLLMSSCYIHWLAGDLQRLAASAKRCVALCDFPHAAEISGYGNYHLGRFHYSRNELELAETHLSTVVQQPHANYGLCFADSVFCLGLVYQARNQLKEAREMASLAVDHMIETGNTSLLQVARAFTSEIALRQNQLAAANQWADQFESFPPLLPMSRVYEPNITLAKVWLAQGTLPGRQRASELLDRLRQYTETTHQTVYLMQVFALQAILQSVEENKPAALNLLSRAIELAQVGGFIRPFVDLGEPLQGLLLKLRDRRTTMDFVDRILAAFEEPMLDQRLHSTEQGAESLVDSADSLTPREFVVLELLARRLTNKEIAQELVVSLGTVKTHTLSIYSKLDVHSRRQAVDKARELGLLASP